MITFGDFIDFYLKIGHFPKNITELKAFVLQTYAADPEAYLLKGFDKTAVIFVNAENKILEIIKN